uniref:TATA-box binding protein n=1 Tax=viral metagenome TaxID=1070528 RepID=A0A6C0LGK0_9ZZZZ
METEDIYFTEYKVSTITCNADLGINLNLDILYENFEITEKFIWIYYPKITDRPNSRGVYPKKKRTPKKEGGKKNLFDNQVTTIFKISDVYLPNLKIFKNGNIQITGIKDKNIVENIIELIITQIKQIYEKNNDLTPNIENIKFNNFIIRMINTDFKSFTDNTMQHKFLIRRKILHKILINDVYNNKCSFEPGRYHGVKLEYFWNSNKEKLDGICNCSKHCFGKGSGKGENNCKKITIAIFESGSVLITGGISFEQIDEAYKYITNILNIHKSEIQKSDLNLLLLQD